MFKKGDIIQHKASGQRALIMGISEATNIYILSYDIDGHVNVGKEDCEFAFDLVRQHCDDCRVHAVFSKEDLQKLEESVD